MKQKQTYAIMPPDFPLAKITLACNIKNDEILTVSKEEMKMANKIAIVAYFGIDGACSASVVKTAHPEATIYMTSAARIADTLQEITETEIHVCGVGITCDNEDLQKAKEVVSKNNGKVFWHCGRGYLNSNQAIFTPPLHAVFVDAKTNTEAVAKHFKLESEMQDIISIARHDPYLPSNIRNNKTPNKDKAFWLNRIDAGIAQYIKYQDVKSFTSAIKHLVSFDIQESDKSAVKHFEENGFKYALQGSSELTRALKKDILKYAKLDEHVFITGETGVGKEYVANLIRSGSKRKEAPMRAINCAEFSGDAGLATSFLFGHLKGAFTGAVEKRVGAFCAVDGGVLFLDEFGELPLDVQAKLLRVLEDGQITPLGSDKPTATVNVRVIVATNSNLKEMVAEKTFRADLIYRLSILQLKIPPLRERREDIFAITNFTLDRLKEGGNEKVLTKKEWALLNTYAWPGNVRQLITVLKRATLLGISIFKSLEGEEDYNIINSSSPLSLPSTENEIRKLDDVRKEYASAAYAILNNYTTASKALGISKNTLKGYIKN